MTHLSLEAYLIVHRNTGIMGTGDGTEASVETGMRRCPANYSKRCGARVKSHLCRGKQNTSSVCPRCYRDIVSSFHAALALVRRSTKK